MSRFHACVRVFCTTNFVFFQRLHWNEKHFSFVLALQKIAEQKLQAFAIGAMGQRPLSRREQEERRKREEEQAAASVCESYYSVFTFSINAHSSPSFFRFLKSL